MRKLWKVAPAAPRHVLEGSGLPPLVTQVLYNRGITTPAQISSLFDSQGQGFHDPFLLPGMKDAVFHLSRAVEAGETIGIFGDFDVDGVTATSLLAEGLFALGARVAPYIPHRVNEGHGLNREAVQALKELGVSLLVTVDCGVTSLEEVALAADLGMGVIITDHHVPPPRLPPALAIVDPKIGGTAYPCDGLSGAGLALKLLQGLYDLRGLPWPHDMAGLAALGTVADLAPLVDENRYLVQEGLKQLRRTQRPGLQALYRQAGLRPESIDAQAISFIIAPRLNASGRLEHAMASYQLLTTKSMDEAQRLAIQIEGLNRERQQMTETAYQLAREQVLALDTLPPILLVTNERFTPGISGLVASRLVEEFYRPAVVMAPREGLIRASGRSVAEFNLVGAFHQCGDLFTRMGGHPQAAGFVMASENLPQLEARLLEAASSALAGLDMEPTLRIDAEATPRELMGESYRWLGAMEPFGPGNPTPLFLGRNMELLAARTMGNQGQHLRLKLKGGGATWDAVAFRQGKEGAPDMPRLDLVYTLVTEHYNGERVLTMRVADFRPSSL